MQTTQLTNEVKDNVLQKLRTGETIVRFTKVDGSERTMRCTLQEEKIPTSKRPKQTEASSSVTGSAIRAFDLDIGEWRSFRVDSIISF